MSAASFRDLIDHHFNQAELQQLCFDLQISYENLPGETRIMKAQALVQYSLRQDRLPDLHHRCQLLRPDVAWPDAATLAAEWQQVQNRIQAQDTLRGLVPDEQLDEALARLQQNLGELVRQLVGTPIEIHGDYVAGDKVSGDKVDGPKINIEHLHLAKPSASSDQTWIDNYLKILIARCNQLDLTEVDERLLTKDGNEVALTDVFTTLYAARSGQTLQRRGRQTVAQVIRQARIREAVAIGEMRAEDEGEPVTAITAAGALPRLVILGHPGGGKSSLVNYLAARLAAAILAGGPAPFPEWPDQPLLPVRIILRRFAAWISEIPASSLPETRGSLVWRYLAEKLLPEWSCAEAHEPIRQLLLNEGGIIFFDGLDEVPESAAETQRTLIKDAIADFALPLEKCKIVVTCREYAYGKDDSWRLPTDTFPHIELALFWR